MVVNALSHRYSGDFTKSGQQVKGAAQGSRECLEVRGISMIYVILIDNRSSAVQCSMILIDDLSSAGCQEKRRGGGDFARLYRGDLEGGTARQVGGHPDHLGGDHQCLDVARDVDHGG